MCRRALGKGRKISLKPDYYLKKTERMEKMYEIKPQIFHQYAHLPAKMETTKPKMETIKPKMETIKPKMERNMHIEENIVVFFG
jgi:hypothetical protein